MYLYSFSLYAGQDRVFFYKNKNSKYKKGSLIHNNDGYFLILGEEISFPELYATVYETSSKFTLIEKDFLSENTLQLLHWMVYHRYSPYKNVIKHFLSNDIPHLLAKKSKISKKIKKSKIIIGNISISADSTEKNQVLIIIPDLWTRENAIRSSENILTLNTQDSQSKKDTNRRKIKNGEEILILATSAEIFQDFKKLSSVYLIEPQKRYYANQQDPRYKVATVAEKIASLHKATLQIIDSEELTFNKI